MQLDERLHQRQSEPEAAVRARVGVRPWLNGWNSCGTRAGSRPMPVSRVSSTASCLSGSSCKLTDTVPPVPVNLIALLSRLPITCERRCSHRAPAPDRLEDPTPTCEAALFERRVLIFEAVSNGIPQIQGLALHPDLSLRDARDIEQVVDEARSCASSVAR